jgi:hypothetical protein
MQDWIDVRRDIFLRFSEEQRFEALGSNVMEGARYGIPVHEYGIRVQRYGIWAQKCGIPVQYF